MEKKIVDIFDVSYEGAGVGKLDGKIVFVPKTLSGEKVEISVLKENGGFAQGKIENVIEKSEDRIDPVCPYFDRCGGCDFQHCTAQREKEIKKEILKEELQKVGFNGEIEFVDSENRFGYRNKIKLEILKNKMGYFEPKSHNFFEIKTCPIADENINKILPKIKSFLKENNFQNLKNVYIRCFDEKIAICFLFSKNAEKMHKNIKKIEILGGFSVFFAYGNILESDKTHVYLISGNNFLTKKYQDFEAEYDVSAFCQINDFVEKKLYDFVLKNTKNKRVINAYSGQGVLTYLISKDAKFVYGIEFQNSAHQKAEKLKENQNEYKIENICAKVEDVVSQILMRDKIDVIVLDPARDGCDKAVLNEILNNKIEEILYISCNFATLTRDLKILKDFYCFKTVKIFDMFPCTANLETAVILRRK